MPDRIADATFHFAGRDGTPIFARRWATPSGRARRAVLQIAHGAAEHSLRYERVARFLNAAGYGVYANDHRGHGRTAASPEALGLGGADAWNDMVEDLAQLTQRIRSEHPDAPIFLLGHSMGSLLAQRYVERWGHALQGVVWSGTFGAIEGLDAAIAALQPLASGEAAREPSATFQGMFASFNQPFTPAKTGFEWLSRDEAEVRKYVDDPLCGFPFSNGLAYALLTGARETWRPENERRVPPELPVFVICGGRDPVGRSTADVLPLIERHRANGVKDITHRFYTEARHELLNETNRDEVQFDLLRWLEAHLTAR